MVETTGPLLASWQTRVTMRDVDAAGIIYFAAPYAWEEALYLRWLDSVGHPIRELLRNGTATPAVASSARYLSALRVDDTIALELRAGHVGTKSFSLVCDVFRQPGQVRSVQVHVTHVWARLGHEDGVVQSAPVPAWLDEALTGPQS